MCTVSQMTSVNKPHLHIYEYFALSATQCCLVATLIKLQIWANGKWHLHRLPLKAAEVQFQTHTCILWWDFPRTFSFSVVAACGSDCRISPPFGKQRVTNATLMTLTTFLCKCERTPRWDGRTAGCLLTVCGNIQSSRRKCGTSPFRWYMWLM